MIGKKRKFNKEYFMEIITHKELLNLAKISQIAVNENELQKLAAEVGAVLHYASSLKKIAKNIKPDESYKNINVTRKDEIIRTDEAPILAQAPVKEENYFVVPSIIKHN
ncbi:Asp-tRNA(Asn)/Glu-tRNA(Gln) amidotransferase subunit GatC [Candidatus Dependentiae bacterium]|nr:Asp-tRNA(Asn)/Glu-tRNA(Gln) amidotransferase subunit GatC [Candidatus Dependentiae bacterium]